MAVAYHTHSFTIPVASTAESEDGLINDKVITPAQLQIKLSKSENLADLENAAEARDNIGLGDSAVANVGTTAGTVAAGDDSRLELAGSLPVANIISYRRYDVRNYGADPANTASVNTASIQTAINEAFDDGGGEVFIPLIDSGIYQTQSSTETDEFQLIAAGPSIITVVASDYVSLLLRSRVHLILDDGVVIENQRNDRSILGLLDMAGGGVYNGTLRGLWTPGETGAGHGIFTFVTGDVNDTPNRNIEIDGVEIANVASYGLGMQYGFFKNNKYRNLHIHDTGADGIDHKARPMLDGTVPTGMVAENILVERWGRRAGLTASAAIDVRGALKLSKITAREGGYSTHGNVGIRLSAGIRNEFDYRSPSQGAILEGFDIDAGDPTITGTKGLVLLDSGAIMDDGNVRNFEQGVSVENSSSGYGSNEGAIISNVRTSATRSRGFYSTSARVKIINCEATGQVEDFESAKGNLVDGQTSFTSPRAIDGTVQVYKNGVLLALTTDYTLPGGNVVLLVSGVLVSDVIRIVVPTPIGFRIDDDAVSNSLVGCSTQYAATPRSVSAVSDPTLAEVGNRYEDLAFVATGGDASNAYAYARGPDANIEYQVYPKGTAGTTLRSREQRALRAVNATGTEVNWAEVSGSVDGSPVALSAQGSSSDIEFSVAAKGNSGVALRSRSAIAFVGLNEVDSAVNYVEAQGSAGTSPVSLYARGTSTNLDFNVHPKGNAGFTAYSQGNRAFSAYNSVTDAVNYVQANGSATGVGVALAAQGSDTNIDLRLLPKGTGRVRFGTLTVNADAPVTGYIEIRDAGGTVRKLAVIA